jgi:hypothetical protein
MIADLQFTGDELRALFQHASKDLTLIHTNTNYRVAVNKLGVILEHLPFDKPLAGVKIEVTLSFPVSQIPSHMRPK